MIITCKVCNEFCFDGVTKNAYCLKFGHEIYPEEPCCDDADFVDEHYYTIRERFKENT